MRKCSETRITAHKTSLFIGSSFPFRSANGILPEAHRDQTAAVTGLLQVDPEAFWCQAFFGKRTPDAFFIKLLDITVQRLFSRLLLHHESGSRRAFEAPLLRVGNRSIKDPPVNALGFLRNMAGARTLRNRALLTPIRAFRMSMQNSDSHAVWKETVPPTQLRAACPKLHSCSIRCIRITCINDSCL